MKRFVTIALLLLTGLALALPPFIGVDSISRPTAVSVTNYFYWEPTNVLVSFNGSPGRTYPQYRAEVSDVTNTLVECSSDVDITMFAATNLQTFNDIVINQNPSLGAVFFPALTNINKLDVHNTAIAGLSLPELLNVSEQIYAIDCTSMTTFSAPKLINCPTLLLSGNTVLLTVSLPELLYNAVFTANGNSVMYSLSLAAAESLGDVDASSSPFLTNFVLNAATEFNQNVDCNINFNGCSLKETPVNNIMIRAWADTPQPNNDTIDVSGGVNATPTGTGFTTYQSLTNAGNSVQINP